MLVWTEGYVSLLVVLYTVNVFITFALSLLGLTIYWWRQRRDVAHARRNQTPLAMQRLLNLHALELVILPVMLDGHAPHVAPAVAAHV